MRRIAILFIGLFSALSSTALAGDFFPVPFSFSVEVIATDPGITVVAVGDRFEISGVIDQGIFDVNSSVGGGRFPGLVVNFAFAARPLNAGTWNPAGTFDLAGSNYVTNAFGNNFTFQLRGTGFPDGGPGLPFFDIDLGWLWPGDITDSGLNDNFGGQFGGGTFNWARAVLRPSAIRFQAGASDFRSATFLPLTPSLAGDYNVNGVVDAADYVAWRDRPVGPGILLNDASPGSVSPADYDVWKANFGATLGTGSAQAAVPEPAALDLAGWAALSAAFRRSRNLRLRRARMYN